MADDEEPLREVRRAFSKIRKLMHTARAAARQEGLDERAAAALRGKAAAFNEAANIVGQAVYGDAFYRSPDEREVGLPIVLTRQEARLISDALEVLGAVAPASVWVLDHEQTLHTQWKRLDEAAS